MSSLRPGIVGLRAQRRRRSPLGLGFASEIAGITLLLLARISRRACRTHQSRMASSRSMGQQWLHKEQVSLLVQVRWYLDLKRRRLDEACESGAS